MARAKWRDRHWDARLAHDAVLRAVARGDLTPRACEVCGAAAALAHHDDYERRLEVRWLCDRHHRLHHIDHPITHEVPAPPKTAPKERRPNRGKQFRRYLKPRAIKLREEGYGYQFIAQELGISIGTAYKWCNTTTYR